MHSPFYFLYLWFFSVSEEIFNKGVKNNKFNNILNVQTDFKNTIIYIIDYRRKYYKINDYVYKVNYFH